MKITHFGHSCLLVEDNGKSILMDPGNFSEQYLDIPKIPTIDFITITHQHADHMHIPLIKKVLGKFPNVQIIANDDIVQILAKENIPAKNEENEFIKFREAPHEKMFGGWKPPINYIFEVFGKLSHPGDSFHFDLHTDMLAMPTNAPWGSTTEAVEIIERLKPKIVIPIHDALWKDQVRHMFYPRMGEYLKEKGIDFRNVDYGESTEV